MADDERQKRAEILAGYKHLNELFYTAESPSSYFYPRVRNLIFQLYAPEKLAALDLDYQAEGTHIILRAHDELDEEDRRNISRFTTIEATILLHHIAETLLRLFLAHEKQAPCPSLEVTSLTSPKVFKQALRTRFVDQATSDKDMQSLLRVFLGISDPSVTEMSIEQQELVLESAKNINKILGELANLFLKDAPFYNSVKHGMTVIAAEPFMFIGGHVIGEGPGLTCIEYGPRIQQEGKTVSHINLSTSWIETDLHLVFIQWAAELIDQLWVVAQARYLGKQGDIGFPVFPKLDKFLEALAKQKKGFGFRKTMSMPLSLMRVFPSTKKLHQPKRPNDLPETSGQ